MPINNALSTYTLEAPHPETVREVLTHYEAAAMTASTTVPKVEFVITCYYRIFDVIIDSATGSVGISNDIVDIKVNGTSIYPNTGASILGDGNEVDYRPFILPGDTGGWKNHRIGIKPGYTGGSPSQPNIAPTVSGITSLKPGDILAIFVPQVNSTGSARVKFAIVLGDA